MSDFEIQYDVLIKYNGSDREVVIPNGVKAIGEKAFAENTFLESVRIPEGVTEIGANAFELCEKLVEVKLPESLEKIGSHCFADCSSLMAVNIPDNVKLIDHHAFFNCGLKTVKVPENVDGLGILAFGGNNPIGSINIAAGNKKYVSVDGVVYNKSMEKLYMFPQNMQVGTFVVPDGVKAIYAFAFAGVGGANGGPEVVISESVTEIMEQAFFGAVTIGDIYVPETVTVIGEDAFQGCRKAVIHGKPGSEAEKAAERDNVPFSAEWKVNLD